MKLTTKHGSDAEQAASENHLWHPAQRKLTTAEIEALVAYLEATGDFRVLRRLVPLPFLLGQSCSGLRCAIVLDTETTGLILPAPSGHRRSTRNTLFGAPSGDRASCETIPPASEIVSLGIVAVAYDLADGEIKGAIGRFHKLRQPSHSIPEAATRIHRITNEDVRGCTITAAEVAEWIALVTAAVYDGAAFGSRDEERLPLIVAHNAAFDRPMVEALFPNVFRHLPWACSYTQVPWADYGFEGSKLAYLTMRAGRFYDTRHSAFADADAVVELLRQKLRERFAMATLREAALRETYRVFVTTRYDPKTIADLKGRGYRWDNGEGNQPRAWFWEGSEELDAELAYLEAAGHREIAVALIDAFDRFSGRPIVIRDMPRAE